MVHSKNWIERIQHKLLNSHTQKIPSVQESHFLSIKTDRLAINHRLSYTCFSPVLVLQLTWASFVLLSGFWGSSIQSWAVSIRLIDLSSTFATETRTSSGEMSTPLSGVAVAAMPRAAATSCLNASDVLWAALLVSSGLPWKEATNHYYNAPSIVTKQLN